MKPWHILWGVLALLAACEKPLVPQQRETTCVNGIAQRLESRNGHWYLYNEHDSLITLNEVYTKTYFFYEIGCSYFIGANRQFVIHKTYERDSTTGDTLSYVYCDEKGKMFRWYAYMPVGVELLFWRYTRAGKTYDVSSRWDQNLRDTVMKTVIAYRSGDVAYEETLEGGNRQFYEEHYSPDDSTLITRKYYYANGMDLSWYYVATDSLESVQYYCK